MGTEKQGRPPKTKRYRPGDALSADDFQKASALEELLVCCLRNCVHVTISELRRC